MSEEIRRSGSHPKEQIPFTTTETLWILQGRCLPAQGRGQPEIDQPRIPGLRIKYNIGRVDILVDDIDGVDLTQPLRHLNSDR